MDTFHFDNRICRKGTGCNKWGSRTPLTDHHGRDILPFTIADMDFAVPDCITDALKKRMEHPIFGYTHPERGLNAAFLGWMQRRHGLELDGSWVKPTTGILTGVAFALRTIAAPGDRVLVFTPVYNPFFKIIEAAGCELVECPLKMTDSYSMDLEAVEAEMRRGLKAILFCNPHNPAGRVWTRGELEALSALCLQYGVYLLSDEAHADFSLFGHTYTPAASLSQLGGLVISSISPNKSFNIPGISIAFLVCRDTELLAKISDALRGVWLTCPPIFSMVAAEAGYNGADEWMDAVCRYIERNSVHIRAYLDAQMPKITVAPHEGTYLLWLDTGCFGKDSGELAEELAMEYGVRLAAGKDYRGDGAHHLRFNIAAPREMIDCALERMLAMYQAYFPKN